MSGRGILDADMKTIGRWIAEGWGWWVAEMREMVPASLRGRRGATLPALTFRNGRLLAEGQAMPTPGARVDVRIARDLCLVRTVERPAIGERDLQHMLALEGDKLLPFPAGTMIVAGRRVGTAESGRAWIEVGGMAVETAQTLAATVQDAGVNAESVIVEGHDDGSRPLDFAAAMREAGLLSKRRSATPLVWGIVAFLVALNIATLVWRDMASVDRLAQIVAEQQPGVDVARAIGRRAARDAALVQRSQGARRTHDASADLALVAEALPEGAWLQRYVWNGATVRLSGYRPPRTDVVGALRRSGSFARVVSLGEGDQTATAEGEPFDLSADIVR